MSSQEKNKLPALGKSSSKARPQAELPAVRVTACLPVAALSHLLPPCPLPSMFVPRGLGSLKILILNQNNFYNVNARKGV